VHHETPCEQRQKRQSGQRSGEGCEAQESQSSHYKRVVSVRITLLDYKAVHIRVPDHAPVLDADLIEALVDVGNLLNTLVKGLLCTK
jgi:hypothetical protein